MIERIQELREQAEAEISQAGGGEALEELRVRWLGRKAELPQLLRGVAQLPAEERGAVGKAANQARQALEALIEARTEQLGGAELELRLREDRVDVTLPDWSAYADRLQDIDAVVLTHGHEDHIGALPSGSASP